LGRKAGGKSAANAPAIIKYRGRLFVRRKLLF